MRLEGLHHITAITGDARANVAFYTELLGLRMVAKTVNQDDPSAYHLFFADEQGHPGSDITFFEYPGAPRGQAGAGMVHRVVWRVASEQSLAFWESRLGEAGVGSERADGGLIFSDGEGLSHELLIEDVPDEPLVPEHPEIPVELALQGFAGVRAYSMRPESSAATLERVLGASETGEGTWELRGDRRGGSIHFDAAPGRGLQGAGTIHHIAWFSTVDDHPKWLEHVEGSGLRTSGIVDRHYFRSIYFREPGGILYELADDGPGFTRDLPMEQLGTQVILPPWLETQREAIEARLTPLPPPGQRGRVHA